MEEEEIVMNNFMRRKMILSITVCLAALTPVLYMSGLSAREIFNNVSVSEAKYMMDEQNNNKVDFILDVRTGEEYARSHIKDAVLIPIMILTEKMHEIDTGQSILVYCHNGNRSEVACKLLTSRGHKYVFNMLGGIESWIDKGYEVVE